MADSQGQGKPPKNVTNAREWQERKAMEETTSWFLWQFYEQQKLPEVVIKAGAPARSVYESGEPFKSMIDYIYQLGVCNNRTLPIDRLCIALLAAATKVGKLNVQ